MKENPQDFDRALGELVQLHRVAHGLSSEDLATKLSLPSTLIERYEAGSNRLSVVRYWTIMTMLGQDPARVLEQLRERVSLAASQTERTKRSGLEIMASNRGRAITNALAICDEPEVLDALADLILSICVHTKARLGRPGSPRKSTLMSTNKPS